MNINEKTVCEFLINPDQEVEVIKQSMYQPVREKIHIVKNGKEVQRTMLECFKKGGINGIENGSLNELAEILYDTFSFDYHGSTGIKATTKESILRNLRLYEQDTKEENT